MYFQVSGLCTRSAAMVYRDASFYTIFYIFYLLNQKLLNYLLRQETGMYKKHNFLLETFIKTLHLLVF